MASTRVLLCKQTPQYIDVLLLVLLHSDEYSLLPDLYEIFGEESLLKFLDIFAGSTITVPSQDQLATAARNVDIYVKTANAAKKSTAARTAMEIQLSEHYEFDRRNVRKVYAEMKDLVERRMSVDKIFKGLEQAVKQDVERQEKEKAR
jgi:hypothetical protein